jgi:hypothetical protein
MYAVRRIAKAALYILIILFLTSESEYKNQIIEFINEPRYYDLEEEDGEDFVTVQYHNWFVICKDI